MVEVFYALTLSLFTPRYVKMKTPEPLLTLKKAVKAEYEDLVWCNAEDLELYLTRLGGKWLTYNEMQKITITPLGLEYEGQALTQLPQDPQLSLEHAGLSDTDFIQPSDEDCAVGNGFVHVIVVAPQARQLPALREHLQMLVQEQHRTIKEYRNTYPIADFPPEVLEELKES